MGNGKSDREGGLIVLQKPLWLLIGEECDSLDITTFSTA
jgi:hypothetical protein